MTVLSIDIETYSSVDITSAGVYRYAESGDFEVLLFAYAVDEEPVQVVDFACGEKLPGRVEAMLWDPAVIKTAFNAQFERVCLARHFGKAMPPEQWRCSMVHASAMGMSGGLEKVAEIMGLSEQKSADGPDLIRYFSTPCKATKINGGRMRNLPSHDLIRWGKFKSYCAQDVVVERCIREKLSAYPLPQTEWMLWQADQEINENGVMIDRQLVANAIRIHEIYRDELTAEAKGISGMANPNSPTQLLAWLATQGVYRDGLTKDDVDDLLSSPLSGKVRRILEIRAELAKTSLQKFSAMDQAVCADARLRGLLQFYGARTGRWAGRIVQPQNLARITFAEDDLEHARQLVLAGNYPEIARRFGSTANVLSQLIRTAFIASPGKVLIVADLSAIEARCVAWLAGEKWALGSCCRTGRQTPL